MQVTDAKGHILYKKDDVSDGKFAFTTEDYDMFEICFHTKASGKDLLLRWNVVHYGHDFITGDSKTPREVKLSLKHGVEAKNYDDVSSSLCSALNTEVDHISRMYSTTEYVVCFIKKCWT